MRYKELIPMNTPRRAGFNLVQRLVEVSSADISEFTSVATYLPVKRWRDIHFLLMSYRVEQQLRRTEGVVRYGLRRHHLEDEVGVRLNPDLDTRVNVVVTPRNHALERV